MKFLISLFLCSMLAVPVAAQQIDRYLFAGIAGYVDNEEIGAIRSGIGLRAGGGLKFNNRFGIELIFDNTPALDPPKAAELLSQEIHDLTAAFQEYNVRVRVIPTRVFYSSVVGTLTLPAWDRWSWVCKAGLSSTIFEVDVKPGPMSFANYEKDDIAGIFSGGLSLRWNEHRSVEFSLIHTTGDAQSISAHATFSHHF